MESVELIEDTTTDDYPKPSVNEITQDKDQIPQFGRFSLLPVTQTTTVVTTTTVSTTLPPLVLNRPRKRIADWDTTVYPLKDAPTPKELRNFTFELNGKVACFTEEDDSERSLSQLQGTLQRLYETPLNMYSDIQNTAQSSRHSPTKYVSDFRKRQYSGASRVSKKRRHVDELMRSGDLHDSKSIPIAPAPSWPNRTSDVLSGIVKSGGGVRTTSSFQNTNEIGPEISEHTESFADISMTSPQSLSLPSPSASPTIPELTRHDSVPAMAPECPGSVDDSHQLKHILEKHPQSSSILELPKILDTFDDLPQSIQGYMMYHLLKRCNKTTLQVVASIVNPALKRDFLDLLPYELSSQVISYLDVRSLARAAQVSKRWRQLVDDDEYTWKNRLEEDRYFVEDAEFESAIQQGWGLRKSPLARTSCVRPVSNSVSNPNSGLDTVITPSQGIASPYIVKNQFAEMVDSGLKQPLVGRHLYKAIYQKHHLDYNAWMRPKKSPKHLSFESHGRHVVTCLQLDGDKIITGSEDSNINIFDIKTGELVLSLEGHEGGVWALQHLGNTLVSGSTDRTVRVWDMISGQCVEVLEGHTSTVRCLQILPNPEVSSTLSHIIITGSRDSTLRMWKLPELNDSSTGYPRTQRESNEVSASPFSIRTFLGHSQSVRALAADKDILISGSYDCSVRVWEISTGRCIWRLAGHSQKVYSVVLDLDQNRCISGSMDCRVKIWDLNNGTCLHSLDGHTSLVGLLSFSHDRLVSAAADSTLRVWNSETGQCRQTLTAHTGAITCFQHDGDKVISGSDGTLKLWDLKTGQFVRDLLNGLTYVWQVRFDDRRCVAAVQRNNMTFIDVLDFSST